MWSAIANIFTGGITKSIENVAKEWIETDKESAEAKAIMVKTIDPNGKMRRDLAKFASYAYGYYLVVTSLLLFMVAFKSGDYKGAQEAAKLMTDLFLPITTAWGTIVTAAFGVNATNVITENKGKK